MMKIMPSLYNAIGENYNATRQADPHLAERLFALLQPKADGLYIDIGCGTGNYTTALADKGLNFYGVEPSAAMLEVASTCSNKVNWFMAQAEEIGLGDEIFDGAIATLTIHHWTNLSKGLAEINRVLKPGASLVIFTATPQQMRGYWLNEYFPLMLRRSMAQMPKAETVFKALCDAGFGIAGTEKYFVAPKLKDYFLYSGKHHPEYYFDSGIRRHISSFAALSTQDEVEAGLARLKEDIISRRFEEVKASYNNENGDYLFVVAQKMW